MRTRPPFPIIRNATASTGIITSLSVLLGPPCGLAHRIAVLIVTHMPLGTRITLLVDDTLAHKRRQVGLGSGLVA